MENYDGTYIKLKPPRICCTCISPGKLGDWSDNFKSENNQSLDRPSDMTQGANTILTKHLAKILAYGTAYGAVHACVIGIVLISLDKG